MKIRLISLFLLVTYLVGSIYGLLIIGLDLPNKIPLTPILTVMAFIFAFLHAGQREGWIKAIVLVIVVFSVGLFFESVGVATGIVYGPYHYTDQLGPKFLDLVPLLIPVAWTFMMYPSLVIAEKALESKANGWKRWLGVAALGGIIMTAWDVVMDPMMVLAGHWVWDVKGAFFGVPLQNFFGWWLTTFVAMMLYQVIASKIKAQPAGTSDRLVVYSYLITVVSSVLMSLIVGLEGSALAGIFAVLPWLILGIHKTKPN